MYHKHHTKGIVLSGFGGNENRVINLFTHDFGLIYAKVQGARNINSKLRSGVQDYSLGEFSLVHGKTGWKVVSSKVDINIFETLKDHSEKLIVVSNVFNLLKKLLTGEEGDSNLYEIVENFINFIINSEREIIPLAECLVLLRILNQLGLMRHDPEFALHIESIEIDQGVLKELAPRRLEIVRIINESLKSM